MTAVVMAHVPVLQNGGASRVDVAVFELEVVGSIKGVLGGRAEHSASSGRALGEFILRRSAVPTPRKTRPR